MSTFDDVQLMELRAVCSEHLSLLAGQDFAQLRIARIQAAQALHAQKAKTPAVLTGGIAPRMAPTPSTTAEGKKP